MSPFHSQLLIFYKKKHVFDFQVRALDKIATSAKGVTHLCDECPQSLVGTYQGLRRMGGDGPPRVAELQRDNREED